MRHLLPLLLAALPAAAAAPSLETAWPSARLAVRAAADQARTASSTISVGACYERIENTEADRLGLPKRLCLDSLTLTTPAWAPLPFVDEAYMDAAGTPPYRHLHIDGGAREADGWTIDAGLVSRWGKQQCGRLSSAHAAVYARIGLDGRLVDDLVEVRGFLMDGSGSCAQHAPTVTFDYKKL